MKVSRYGDWSRGRLNMLVSFVFDLLGVFGLVFPTLFKAIGAEPVPSFSLVCRRWTLEDTFFFQQDQCPSDNARFFRDGGSFNSRVAEMNGTTLERALSRMQSHRDAYVAVLFYAAWCPFSKRLRPTFDTLSTLFPSIYHVAVEESALRPRYHTFSALSQYGVHSFPSLFLHNKTMRIRYYGPRTVEALSHFYKDITGLEPMDSSYTLKEEISSTKKLVTKGIRQSKEHPWVKTSEKWLHDDMYLALATLFVLLRLLIYVLPKLASGIKHYWVQTRYLWQGQKAFLRRDKLRYAEQDQHGSSSCSNSAAKGKDVRTENLQESSASGGKGGLSVHSWSSSSLGPVTLAEGSSSRVGVSDEGWESGRIHKGHTWG